MEISNHKIRVGTINQELNHPLKSGDKVVILGRATVTEARFKDNHDGTHNALYIAQPELSDIRLADDQTSITEDKKLKSKSRSQFLRQKAFVIAQELGLNAEVLYNQAIDKAEEYLDQVIDQEAA